MEHVGDMRGVPNFVPTLNGNARTSMCTMIRALESLPQITLEATAANTSGEVPLITTITIHASPGVIHSTTGIVTQNGRVVGGPSTEPNVETTTSFDAVEPGQYIFTITRIGVSSTGLTTLQKNFNIDAHPHVIPPPPPIISVSSTGAGTGSNFVVAGSGFLANVDILIRVVDDAFPPNKHDFHQSSDAQGRLNARFSLPCNSGGTLHFSATDSRANPADLTGLLFSNTFNLPCP